MSSDFDFLYSIWSPKQQAVTHAQPVSITRPAWIHNPRHHDLLAWFSLQKRKLNPESNQKLKSEHVTDELLENRNAQLPNRSNIQ
jgi:hypothetical protein